MASEITQELRQSDIDELMRDVERYLAAVEAFRAEGCEPVWASDEMLVEAWRLEWTERPHRELPSVETGVFYRH